MTTCHAFSDQISLEECQIHVEYFIHLDYNNITASNTSNRDSSRGLTCTQQLLLLSFRGSSVSGSGNASQVSLDGYGECFGDGRGMSSLICRGGSGSGDDGGCGGKGTGEGGGDGEGLGDGCGMS